MKNTTWKENLITNVLIAIVFFIAAAMYFWPAMEGKIIYAGDNINAQAAQHESNVYAAQTGEHTFWTNSMFSGMPTYQLGGHKGFIIDKIMSPVQKFFSWGLYNTAFLFLFYLCAFFLLLRAFKVDKWLSFAGAFAIALSSYFFIIIAAQHHGKCYSITWMTLVVVGFLLTYQKQYGWGALITMFFTYIGFFLHPQMSYYICMMMGVFFFAELALAWKDKAWKHFAIATVVFAVSFAVGMGMGSANIFTNMEYAEQTMRGGHSDLVKEKDVTNKTEGLDLDYATAWSYGIDESMTFLIPNYMGGCSGYNLGQDSELYKNLVHAGVPRASAKQFCQSAPTYWGDKAFTSGAVYMGAIICFLFLLGLLVVKGPYKWALLVATLFSVFLAWGRHFMPLTELFFKYFPMYNKFRAVESILIVAEITMPLLAFFGLQQLVSDRGDKKANAINLRKMYIAAGITAGICLMMALFGKYFVSFTSSYDEQWKGQVGEQIYQMIVDQRAVMMVQDAWRSFVFILLAVGLIWVYLRVDKFKTIWFGVAMALLVVVDMWPVDRRFCNDSQFVFPKKFSQAFEMQPYEKYLLDNDTTQYRVLNLTTNTFNEARTSYYLKSIGGYSAAKLRRYQDLIDEHISKMHMPVLNMLNTKYFIVQRQDGQIMPQLNPDAMGNAWFVDSLLVVETANEESDALNTIDIHTTAVLDKEFEKYAANAVTPSDATASIELVKYAPNRLEYKTQSAVAKTAVFSEIYYPYGWKVSVDGNPVDLFRVNYMLRAVNLPAGEHAVIFSFEPDSVRKGNMLSLICFGIMLLTLVGVGGYKLWKLRKSKSQEQ
jgi:hypothetical protein